MTRTEPIKNPGYTEILYAIISGYRTPKQIKIFLKNNDKKQNFSMKLNQLKKLRFIERKEKKNYYIVWQSLLSYIVKNILNIKDKQNSALLYESIINSKLNHKLLANFLLHTAQNMKETTAKISIKVLLMKFSLGIGFIETKKYNAFSYHTMLVNSGQLKTTFPKNSVHLTANISQKDIMGYGFFTNYCRIKFLSNNMDFYTGMSADVYSAFEIGKLN